MQFVRVFWVLLILVIVPGWGGQTLVRSIGDKPAVFHPQYEVGSNWQNVLRDLFEPLMRLDNEGKVLPGQARSYSIDRNDTRYRFLLRDDIYWSDGTPVTAEDFVYSFRYALSHPDKHFDWFLAQIPLQNITEVRKGTRPAEALGIRALGPHRLEIRLDHPFPYLISALSHLSTVPLPRHLADRPWPSPRQVIGNGPYRIQRVTVNTIELEKNPYYYDKARIDLDRVVYWNNDEESISYRRYREDRIDFLNEIPRNLYKTILRDLPEEVHSFPIFGTYYLSLNLHRPPMDRLEVRQALAYAVDRQKLAGEVMGSGEEPMYTFIPRGMSGYTHWQPDYQRWGQLRRETRARVLLRSAGYTPEHPLNFHLLTNENERNKRAMLAVISMWKEVFGPSIHVRLEVLPWDRYKAAIKTSPAVRSGWVADYDNPVSMLVVLTRGHMYNISSYDNPRYDALLKQANRTVDPHVRSRMFRQLEEMILTEWPIIPLFQYAATRLIKPWVHGYPARNPLDVIQSRYLHKEPSR